MPAASAPPSPPGLRLEDVLSLRELEELAESNLDRMAWDYYRSGSWDESTLRRNVAAWAERAIFHRVMVDVSTRQCATTILGLPSSFPLWIAPTAMQRLCCPDGESATARAASRIGVPMVLSSLSTQTVEEVTAAAAGVPGVPAAPILMQIYVAQDRDFTRSLVARAEAAGCAGFVLTVDTPAWGVRERDVHNHFHVPPGLRIANLERPGVPTGHQGRGIGESLGWTIDPSLSWKDLERLASWTSRPVLVKGVCRPDDALQALDHGAAGVIVSNHGGRQLDGAPATAESLEPVALAVAGRAPVLVDGGIRRGADVLRAVALGASAVLVGRPLLWGLAAAGEAGAFRALEILRNEFDLTMALAGCPSLSAVTRDLLAP